MAEGGDVSSFCSEPRTHDEKCKYATKISDVINKLSEPKPDPNHVVNGYVANKGLAGLLKLTSNDNIDNYASSSSRGHKDIDNHINSVFSDGEMPTVKDVSKTKDFIHDWISKGGITNDLQKEMYKQHEPEMFAEGGKVEKRESLHNPDLALMHPEQNMLIQATKGSASNYLNSLRPENNQPKLAFDTEPDQSHKEKSYQRALHIANEPLSVLREIKKGTIEPEHLKHLNAIFPDLNQSIQKKITEKITEKQLNGEKPNHIIRQGLSLMLGTPLSGELNPQNIIAAQATFQQPSSPNTGQTSQQPSTKNKKSTSSLTKSDQAYLTGNQALIGRSQKQ